MQSCKRIMTECSDVCMNNFRGQLGASKASDLGFRNPKTPKPLYPSIPHNEPNTLVCKA